VPATVDQGAASALALVFHFVAARVYPLETYGWLVLVWSTIAFGVLFWRALLGVPFVVRYSAAEPVRRPALFDVLAGATLRLIGGLGVVAVLIGMGATVGVDPSLQGAGLFAAGAVVLAASLYRETWRHLLIADLEAPSLGVLGAMANGVAALAFALAAFWAGWPAGGALVALGVGVVAGVRVVRPRHQPAVGSPTLAADLRDWWSFGRHIVLGVLCTNGVAQVVVWWLLATHGEGEVALFGAASVLAGLPRPALSATTAILTPRIARETRVDGDPVQGRHQILGATFLAALGLAALGALLGPIVMSVVFPSVPGADAPLIGVLAAVFAVDVGNALLRCPFLGDGRP